ncbi:predicted protein [Naegleria gruberi]|uniref:Predicted protein n=1 Tax=Naegleria gruberi TaxID=5762 RepID=D2W150_NAEGR|nr:uncharacterized protein NAEGRDRAFT_53887 [Naegleria gruberi]EFC37169.1 predicted protein [Naegleria gruberi]|eukprot:XP_002669913.1 predicted protein [Naegleria gruberi strain NEG-M]
MDRCTRERIFKDEIHGQIAFISGICKQVIDTESFQRLRDLKQLGSCYHVFPGASHNRFEHCLGVAHLSKRWIDKFYHIGSMKEHNKPNFADMYILQVAALCHDLGHGPFSHVFDNEFIPRALNYRTPEERKNGWTHEQGSKTMFEYMLEETTNDIHGRTKNDDLVQLLHEKPNDFVNTPQTATYSEGCFEPNHFYDYDGISLLDFQKREKQMVFDMIDGRISNSERSEERQYLYQIVANKFNSVDVDKFDYLTRDCQNLGLISSYDSSRLMEFSRVIGGEICFSSKEVYNLYEMFHTRYNLHKQVYTHRVGKSVEYMITDALVEADPYLKISEMINHPEQYVHLSDSILYRIESSDAPELEKSRQLLKRIKRRQLYKFVDEIILPIDRHKEFESLEEIDITSCHNGDGELLPSDIIIHNMAINYALKDKNPVDQCLFYKNGSDESFKIAREQVSYLIPSQFIEKYVRVFVRDVNKLDIAYSAFQNWIQRNRLQKQINI